MEWVFRSLKSERVPNLGYRSLPDATKGVGVYLVDYYNRQWPHTFNGEISPVAVKKSLTYCLELVGHYIMQLCNSALESIIDWATSAVVVLHFIACWRIAL